MFSTNGILFRCRYNSFVVYRARLIGSCIQFTLPDVKIREFVHMRVCFEISDFILIAVVAFCSIGRWPAH